ncbi:hypothetical protein BD779DRAFT_1787104 [Infundibulicybe gibba]|nr:hypothetical protein BD779DRAFT_1787104 [Infundibulicybe gibba]
MTNVAVAMSYTLTKTAVGSVCIGEIVQKGYSTHRRFSGGYDRRCMPPSVILRKIWQGAGYKYSQQVLTPGTWFLVDLKDDKAMISAAPANPMMVFIDTSSNRWLWVVIEKVTDDSCHDKIAGWAHRVLELGSRSQSANNLQKKPWSGLQLQYEGLIARLFRQSIDVQSVVKGLGYLAYPRIARPYEGCLEHHLA